MGLRGSEFLAVGLIVVAEASPHPHQVDLTAKMMRPYASGSRCGASNARKMKKQFQLSRMGTERRIQMIAQEQNRDISEKVALGFAKPSQLSESMWGSRLFNQTSGFDTGFNEDQAYDKPLFAIQDAIGSIYRLRASKDDDGDEEVDSAEYDKIQKSNRFEVLGKVKEGFKGAADAQVSLVEALMQFWKPIGWNDAGTRWFCAVWERCRRTVQYWWNDQRCDWSPSWKFRWAWSWD